MNQKLIKLLDKERRQLVFFKRKFNKHYWDNHWLKYLYFNKNQIYKLSLKSFVCQITKKYLKPKDGPILEGGCGLGFHVHSLTSMKYDVIGIDTAEKVIKVVQKKKPYLKMKVADVQNIPYPDNYFAGYWSIGVIEHFFNGYFKILDEMKRVVMQKGYLFISFPYMSPFRILKSKFNLYKIFNTEFYKNKNSIERYFYQFTLNKELVIKEIESRGFKLKYIEPKDGIKGLKDEIFFLKFFFKRFLQLLFDIKKNKILILIKIILDKILVRFFGHSILLIFQKLNDNEKLRR